MAVFNAVDYARNVGKSAKFIGINTIKSVNPAFSQYVSDNVSAVKDMYESVKEYKQNARMKATEMTKGEAGKFGKDLIKNALDDIKTGKFYNEDRANDAINDFMNIDVDFDSSDTSNTNTADQTVTSTSMDYIMGKSSRSNAKAAITSADIVSKTIKGNTRAIMAHNERLAGSIVTSIAAVHSSIMQLNQAITGPLNTHIQNSTTFYKTATEQLALQTGYLKELKELFIARYGGKKSSGGFGSTGRTSAWKSVMSGDFPNLIELGRGFKDEYKNETSMLSMLGGMIDDDIIRQMRMSDAFNSPIASLISMGLATGLRNSKTGRGFDRFSRNIGGMFATGMGRINAWGRSAKGMNSWILGPLARMMTNFIPKSNNKFDTGRYEKGRVDWTGMADKALREVIPTQLAQILSAITGKEPKIFDYNTGRWVRPRDVSNSFRTARKNAISSSQSGFRDEVLNRFNTAYNTSSSSKAAKSFKQDYDNLIDIIARTNVDPTNPTELRNYLKRKGLMGSGDKFYIHEENFNRIMQILGFAPDSGKFGKSRGLGFGFAKSAYDAREANSDFMANSSMNGGAMSIVRSGAFSRSSRNVSGLGLSSIVDDKGNSIFFYLQSFYSDLKAIRHSILNGSPNTKRKGTRKRFGSSISDQDLRNITEVPDNRSKSTGGFKSSSRGNVYYDPEDEENLRDGFREKKDKTIFERATSEEGLSDEEIAAMNPLKRIFYKTSRKIKAYKDNRDNANTIFDNLNETMMDIVFGKERDKNILEKGIVGAIQELPDRINEALHALGNRLWDNIKNSKIFQSVTGTIKDKWNNFKQSDGFQRFKNEFKSSPSGFMKNSFKNAYKDFKGAFAAVRSRGVPNEPGTAAGGGQVLRSGVVSVSEGEYIVPADENPYYTGHMSNSSRRAIESMNKRGFLNSSFGNNEYWGEYAKGGKVKRKKNKGKRYRSHAFNAASATAKAGKVVGKKVVKEGKQEFEDIIYDVTHTEIYQDIRELLSSLTSRAKQFEETMFGDNETYQKGKAGAKQMVDFIRPYLPETLAGSTIGALIGGAATGSPLGLLGGLVIGSGVNLARHSTDFSKFLFGDINEIGDRTGGLFNAKVSNFLTKKFPKMAQYGAVGSVLGALGLAPGGVLGGFVIGAGLNLVKDTEEFSNMILGHKGVDGKRRGGLAASIQLRIVDPVANYIQDELKGLKGYVKKWALDPLKNVFNPLQDWVKGVSSKVLEGMDRAFQDHIVKPLAEKLDVVIKPLTQAGGFIGRKLIGAAKAIGTVPGRALNAVGNRMQLHNIRMGYSTLSPEERLQFMNQHSMRTKGSNFAARMINRIPGGSRVTGAVSGFMDRHDFINRHTGGANALKYTQFAANASTEDLEDFYYATIGREKSIKSAQKENRRTRQDLRNTLVSTMKDGGLNDPRSRRELSRLLERDDIRQGGGADLINEWIDRQVASGNIDQSNAQAAKDLVSEKLDRVSKLYQREQSFNTDDWKAREQKAFEKSGLSREYIFGKNGKARTFLPRMVLSDLENRKKAESQANIDKQKENFSGDSNKKLNEAIDSNPVEKEKLGILERIANLLSSIVAKETGEPVKDNNNSSYGKTKSSTSSNKNSGQAKSDKGIKIVTTADGVPIQMRANSEGGYSPDMSDSTTADYMNDKERDRSIRNGFYMKMAGAGGLLDTLKGLFGNKGEKEDKPSLLEKLWEGAKSLGSGILNSIGNIAGTISNLLSGAGGLSNILGNLGKAGNTFSSKLGGFGGIVSGATFGAAALSGLSALDKYGILGAPEHWFDKANETEANLLGYKRTNYNDGEYQRNYTVENSTKNIMKYGVLGGSKRYGKLVNRVHGGLKKGLESISAGGLGKIATGAKNAFSKVSSAGSGFLTGNIANQLGKSTAGYNLLDKAYNNKILTSINDKGVIGFALDEGGSLVSRTASGAKSLGGKALNAVKSSTLGKAATSSSALTSLVGRIKDVVKKMLGVLGKSADDGILRMVDDVAKGVGQNVLKAAPSLAGKLAKALPFINLVMYGLAFENGMEDAYAVLQVSPNTIESPSLSMRVLSGGATLLSEVLFGIIRPETCANVLITILELVGIGDFTDIRNAQELTKQEFEQYNQTHPGEEYNNVYEYLKNVYGLYTLQDRAKKLVGGAVDTITGGVKAVGGFVVDKGKALIEGAKDLGSKAVNAVKGFGSGVVNTAKKFGNAASNVAKGAWNKATNIASGAVEIAKGAGQKVLDFGGWIAEGFTAINKMRSDMEKTFMQKDTNMSDVMNTDIQVSESNPLGGIIKNIGGVVKITTVPTLFIKGLGNKLFNSVLKPAANKIYDTSKSVTNTVTSALGFMAKGDPVGLLQYDTDNSVEDGSNPIGFVNSAAGLAVKLTTIVPTSISWVGHRIFDGLKAVGSGIKTVGESVQQSAINANKYREAGDLAGLFSMDSGNQDGVLGFLSNATDLVAKVSFAGPTAFTAVGNKVKELFNSLTQGFIAVSDSAEVSRTKAEEYRKSGDLIGLMKMDSSASSGENKTSGPLDFISTVQDVSNKITFALPTAFTALGNKAKELFNFGKSKVLDIKEMISTLWEYTDETKRPSMDDYDDTVESFAGDDSGIMGSIMGVGANVIGGVMKGIVSIVRPIVSFGSKIKGKIGGAFDAVKDFITGGDDDEAEATGTGSGIHVSQYGSKASSRRFGRSTVGRNGCGPAVAATVLRSYGRNADLDGTVNFAQANGYVAGSSGVGTKAGFFGDILGRNGIRTKYTKNKSDMDRAIGAGNPTILLGQDRANTSKANSPFGPNPHYIVARGKDSRGNVIVDDPELGSTAIYNKRILKNSKLGIMTGGDSGLVSNAATSAVTATKNAVSNSNTVLDQSNKDDVRKYTWNFFRANGFSEAATAGILGNIYAESNYNPAVIQGNGKGPAAGLFQWENYNKKSSRWKAMSDYAQSKGKNWTDLGSQLEFMHSEMTGSEKWAWKHYSKKSGVSSLDEFKKLNDVAAATNAFMSTMERPGKPHLEKRVNAAVENYNKFTGSNIDPNMVISGMSSTGTTSLSSTSGESSSGSSGFDLGSMLSGIFGSAFRAIGTAVGGTLGGIISSVFGSSSSSSSGSSMGGFTSSSSSYSGGFVSAADASATEKKAIDAMNSIMGKNEYTMSSNRERVFDTVDKGAAKGYGDCSATVRKVLQRATGINIGGNTTDQYTGYASRGGTVVLSSNGAGVSGTAKIDPSKLRPGDALYYSRPTSGYTAGRPDRIGHVEMYMGDGKRAGHGSGMGPKISDVHADEGRFLKAIRFIKDSGSSTSSTTGSAFSTQNASTTNKTIGDTALRDNTDAVGTGSGLPIIDFTRKEFASDKHAYRRANSYRGGASGTAQQVPVVQQATSYSNMDSGQLLQFFNQVIALLTSIATSSGYTPTIVSVLQMMAGTMNTMNSPRTEDTKNQIDQNIALMMQKLDTISQTL